MRGYTYTGLFINSEGHEYTLDTYCNGIPPL